MSEILLYRLNVIPFLKRGDGVSVAEIVETCIRATDALCNLLEMLQGGLRWNISAVLLGKYQIPLIFPSQSHLQMLLSLLKELFFQNQHNERCSRDRSCLSAFGADQIMVRAFFFSLLELLLDRDRTVSEIDRIPSKPADFSLSHSREERYGEQPGERLALLDLFQERGDLRLCERADLLPLDARELDGIRRVKKDIP